MCIPSNMVINLSQNIRIELAKDIIYQNTLIKKESGGWALTNKTVYKKKKPQQFMTYVLFDNGLECPVSWRDIIRIVYDDEEETTVIKYVKKI
jgi:hypothetical protein